ncbi:hypothetical protein Tco_1226310 [Tanacetum coccineum]
MFLKYSTSQIPPKKSRGKGSQGKKTTDTPVADVNVSEESEPEPAKKRNANVALELGKSISLIEVAEEEVARRSFDPPQKLKGVQSLTPEEQEVVDTMKTLKESKKTSRRQPGNRGSSKGTGIIPRVPDESTVVSATSNEGTGTIPGVPDEEKVTSKEKVILERGSEQESEYTEEDQGDDEEVD